MNKFHKILYLTFAFIIILISTFYIKDFRIDASSDTLVAQNDEDFKYFNHYQKIFPNKNSLIIAIKSKKGIDKKLLNNIEILTKTLEDIPEVDSVFSINKAPILFLNNTSLINLSDENYETIMNTEYNIKDVLNEFSENPIYKDQIINNTKNITSLVIFLKENIELKDLRENKNLYILNNTYFQKKSEIDNNRNKLILNIRTIINNSNKDYEYYLGGIEMITSDVISFVKNDIVKFSSLVLLLVIIILFIIFRKIKWVIVILFSSIFAVYTMVGLAGFLNIEVTAVSANFLSLMFILSISMNIHILNNYLQTENHLLETLKVMFWPCFYTFLTTAVAFFSLIISDIKPIIDFGIIMIISLIVILITAFTILPLLISFFIKEQVGIKFKFTIIEFFNVISNKFKKQIIFVNLLLFFIAIYGLTNLNVENSFIKYFKKNTEIYQGMKLIDTELGGTTPLDIIIKFKNEDFEVIIDDELEEYDDDIEFEDDFFSDDIFSDDEAIWFTDDKIKVIKNIHQFLENRDEIGKVISIYTLIDVANRINQNKLSAFELSVLYNKIPEEYKSDLVDPYLNINENMIRISARVKDSKEINRSKLIRKIKNYSNNESYDFEEIKINGLLVLYNNMLSSLYKSQIKSLGFVLLAIFLMFIILFKSFKLSIVGIIPNIFASTFILGLIGIMKIPLDIMTITIAAISIGIAVDNTIHYLYRYKLNISQNLSYLNSIENAHLSVGKAVIITSMAISLGFLVLCLSNFVPTIIFGLFTSLAMIFAMIGVLITLPSIMHYLR